ncbi:glycosyltransferase [Prevotella sp.]
MRILHYINSLKAGNLLSDYILQLTSEQKEYAEVKTLTSTDDFQKVAEKETPDIIHIHACWDYLAAKRAQWAVKKGYAVVLSTHWGLNEPIRSNEQRIRKFIKQMMYQQKTVHQVDAMLVTNEKERQMALTLGWQKRIDVIPNSLLNSSISASEMAEQTILYYNKVLDTRYQVAMSSMENDAVYSLLHVGLARETTHNLLPSDQLLNLRSLNPAQWRRILLYSDDENIREIIDDAISRLQLNAPNIETSTIQRFALVLPKERNPLNQKKIVGTKPLTRQRLNDNINSDETIVRTIAIMLANAHQLDRKQTLSMRHLADLYTMIKYNDYDEDRLAEVLRHMRIYRFSRRIIQLLVDKLHLEEGFRPFSPLADNGLKAIMKRNFKHRY